jgi:hypothetical protein
MELITEPDFYSPSMDDRGNYIDKIPSFHFLHLWTIKPPTNRQLISHKGNGYQAIEIAEGVKKGLQCPCGARKDKVYETHTIFSNHCKTKMHQKWIAHLNQNKMNYFVENEILKKTVENQKLVIAKMEKELNNKSITIDYLTYQIINKNSSNVVVDNLLDFD